jgi:hypothetical protein
MIINTKHLFQFHLNIWLETDNFENIIIILDDHFII